MNEVFRQDLSKIPSDTTELSFGRNFNQPIKVGELPPSLKKFGYISGV